MIRHDLKIWPSLFNPTLVGHRKHDIRVNDRDFHEGDEVFLREWSPETQQYTGRHILAIITHLTQGGEWGLPENLCVMSLRMEYWNTEATA